MEGVGPPIIPERPEEKPKKQARKQPSPWQRRRTRSMAAKKPVRSVREGWQVYQQGEWKEPINREEPIRKWIRIDGRLDQIRRRLT